MNTLYQRIQGLMNTALTGWVIYLKELKMNALLSGWVTHVQQQLKRTNYLKARVDITPFDLQQHPPLKEADDELALFRRAQAGRQAPEELVIPISQQLFSRPFATKFEQGLFLGSPSHLSRSLEAEQFRKVRLMSLSIFKQGEASLTPSEEALERTQQAAKIFFAASYRLLKKTGKPFLLSGQNKCLGIVSVPNSSLVMIAISQDKIPALDENLRRDIVIFLDELNRELKITSLDLTFKLACIPTHSQYFMPRTLGKDSHLPATKDDTEPHTRCVEVALMVALNKIGRSKPFTPEQAGVMAFSSTLWATPDKNESIAIDCFAGVSRNGKYVEQRPLEISLENNTPAFIDIWEPCACHCAIYRHPMAAIAAAGGPGTSFAEPCSEERRIGRQNIQPMG